MTTDPANNTTVSPTKAFISLNFNEAIVAGTGSIELRAGTTLVESFNVATSGRISIAGSILTIDPTANLSGSTSYSLSVPAGAVKDAAGNAIGSSLAFGFATSAAGSDTTAPSLTLASPANAATGVATTSNIELKFSESVQLGTGEIQLLTSSGSLVESFTTGSSRVTVNGDTVTIDPSNELSTATAYRLNFTGNAIQDLAGNGYSSSVYGFQTASLQAAALSVSADKTSVNEGQTVVFTVSAPSLSAGTSIAYRLEGISLKDLDSGSLTGQMSLNAGKTAQLSVRLKADSL
ncbi:MAG: Ig-like domain-containing protein, partial [Burkholderiaceae bacterium]